MRFLILDQSVGKRKKIAKIKLEKESGARRSGTGIISVEPENNKVRLRSQHGGNGGRKNLESKENREKTKNL